MRGYHQIAVNDSDDGESNDDSDGSDDDDVDDEERTDGSEYLAQSSPTIDELVHRSDR